MTNCRRGDVVLVPFPFSDLSGAKQRPAVVISSDRHNAKGEDLILAAITSKLPAELSDEEYLLSQEEQASGGLAKPSIIKISKLFTMHQRLIRRTLGHFPSETMEALGVRLKHVLAI